MLPARAPAQATAADHPFRVMIARELIARRIGELATAVAADHAEPPCLVAVLEGARTFATALQARLPGRPVLHEIRASSYGDGMRSSGMVRVLTGHDVPVQDRDVLLIEDIVDTGRTVAALREHLLAAGARSFRVATLLTKPAHRCVEVEMDYTGFEIPDEFVIGFGMDLAGRFRELRDVAVFDEAAAQRYACA
jgi:hypoxanthine phosphoribosyltransferase